MTPTDEPTVADLFAAGLDRLLVLAADLREADGATPTSACPAWTVRDVYGHLAGICTDVLDGRVEGAGGDEWTARQVAERAGRSLAENVAELAEKGPLLVEALRGFPIDRLVVDQWTHEQDVRGALGRPGSRDEPVVRWSVARIVDVLDAGRREAALPAVGIEGSSGRWVVGAGEPVATVAADDFELARAFLGRRSADQVRSWVVDGDPDAVGRLSLFEPRPDPLVE